LEEILAISDQTFSPLADPLSIEFGAHRWLSSEREESYSDWLGWILEQIKDASQVLKLLGVHDEELLRGCASENPIVKREFRIPGGRLDLSVEFGKHLLVIVEIKTKSFDEDAVLEQLKKYSRWAQNQPQSTRCYFAAVESGEFACPEWIEPLPWRELTLRMRKQAWEWIRSSKQQPRDGSDLIRAAMTLAFCGAVEQNLLGLSGKPAMFRTRLSAEYLEEWVRKREG
jgi:Holliday junction resolvase-like predicted endonuclease